MHAYLFWHIPSPSVSQTDYERRLLDFHQTLTAHAPPGFISSQIFRTQNLPWISPSSNAYEDWYFIENSSALDPLNDLAISGPRKIPHDSIASLASSGAAGLYRLKTGQLESTTRARHSTWFSKPAISYEAFFDQLRPITTTPNTTLWQRQMVLSAAPEFCLRSATKPQLPAGIPAIYCPIEAIHPT
jgi:hypothetical protein